MRLRERAAEDREVLREDEDAPSIDESVSGDDAVAGEYLLVETEVARTMNDVLVELLKSALVEKEVDALARGQLARGVLACDALAAAARACTRDALAQLFEFGCGVSGLVSR